VLPETDPAMPARAKSCAAGALRRAAGASPGQAMVEFLVVLPLLLLLLFGTLQIALILHAKVTLNYAAFEAARAGSLNSARMFFMESAVARTLAALYTHANNVTQFKNGRDRVRKQIEDGYLRIEVVNPGPGAFRDFGIMDDGDLIIPNDNLIYRGIKVGSESMETIQDANVIKVQVYYCYELIVPFANKIMWAMMRYSPTDAMPADMPLVDPKHRFGQPESGTFAEECIKNKYADNGYLGIPIKSQAIMRMQSAALSPGP
jgi:hypothetical protein